MKRMLLDENLPRPLKREFSDQFYVSTVPDQGWASYKNGELISAMVEEGFEYLITADRNIEYQQNLDRYPIKLIVLITFDNRLKSLKSKIQLIEEKVLEMESSNKLLHIDLR